jgi:hypothetical protein
VADGESGKRRGVLVAAAVGGVNTPPATGTPPPCGVGDASGGAAGGFVGSTATGTTSDVPSGAGLRSAAATARGSSAGNSGLSDGSQGA